MKRNCAKRAVTFLMAIAISSIGFVQTSFGQSNEQTTAYAVMFDNSISMLERSITGSSWEPKVDEVKRQGGEFLTNLPAGTAVKVYTFSEELDRNDTITITGERSRQELQKVLNDIKTDGRFTNFHIHLDSVLTEMGAAVKGTPGRPIRLIVWTDGINNPSKAGGPTLEEVLKKHSDVLKKHVKFTYVTLGFELATDVKEQMVKSGVNVVTSLTPDQVIPLIPEFTWSPRRVVVGEHVQFVDHTGGVVRDQVTHFGDGEKSTRRSPVHVYGQPGEYSVSLTVSSPSGETQSVTKKLRVVERDAVVSKFETRPTSVEVGQTVHYTNLTVGEGVSYAWDFGDGTKSSLSHPSHTYDSAGTFKGTLVVTDSDGRTTSSVATIKVTKPVIAKPTAMFTAPTSVDYQSTTRLASESSGPIESYRWLVEGVEVSRDKAFVFDALAIGSHKIIHEVTGPGGTSTYSATLTVTKPAAPVAGLVVGSANPKVGDQLVLTDITKGNHTRSNLIFNGRSVVRDYTVPEAPRTFEMVMDTAGEVTFTLNTFGPGGNDSTSKTVNVAPKHVAPVAKIYIEKTSGRGLLTTKIENQSKGNPIYKSVYDFGNGFTKETEGIEGIEYQFEPGHHQVKVTVYGSDEFTPSTSEIITVDVAKPYPKWVKSLWWTAPSVLLGLAVMGWMGIATIGKIKDLSLSRLNGTLEVQGPSGTREEFVFLGRRSRETVTLHDASKLSLECSFDPEMEEVTYLSELVNGDRFDSASVVPGTAVTMGETSIKFTPSV